MLRSVGVERVVVVAVDVDVDVDDGGVVGIEEQRLGADAVVASAVVDVIVRFETSVSESPA